MNPRTLLTGTLAVLPGLLFPMLLFAQRGDVIIPPSASLTVPLGAQICADRIFANNPGYGSLSLADPSGICSGSVVIPVELLAFSATLQDKVVLLSWMTATELNNYGFEVQRGMVTQGWESLGFVEGHGRTPEPQSYRFIDRLEDVSHSVSLLRYRLKQLDIDGHVEYSPEVEIRLNQPLAHCTLEGYPSPCDDALIIRLSLTGSQEADIRLYDISGRVVMTIAQGGTIRAGNHLMIVRTAAVPSGTYLLVVESGEGRRTEKVMIRH